MKGFGDMHKMLKQAQEMQARLQKEMAELRVEGSSGGGMVAVTVDGHKNVISLKLDPEVVSRDDIDMLQDLIVAAVTDAQRAARELAETKMAAVTGGLKLPGM